MPIPTFGLKGTSDLRKVWGTSSEAVGGIDQPKRSRRRPMLDWGIPRADWVFLTRFFGRDCNLAMTAFKQNLPLRERHGQSDTFRLFKSLNHAVGKTRA